VQLSRLRRAAVLTAGVVLAGIGVEPVAAGVDDQQVTYSFRTFTDADDIHVQSHIATYNLSWMSGVGLGVQLNHEIVTVPGVEGQAGSQETVDAITSASRPISGTGDAFREFSKVRNEIQADIGNERLTAGYYLSKESDYFAQLARAGVNRDFFRQNLNISVAGSVGWDAIEPLLDDDTPGTSDSRTSLYGNIVATQVLTPTTVLRAGAELNRVSGLQYNPYRNVYAGGTPVPELHPERRLRRDVFLKVSQYFRNNSSLKVSYRLYSDDWGITSHTVGAWLNQYVTRDVIVRYRYRYYTQTAAWFYRDEYADAAGINGYRTGDYRLEDFDAHLFGAQISFHLGALNRNNALLRGMDLRFEYERYFNSNNFSANVLESGLAYRF